MTRRFVFAFCVLGALSLPAWGQASRPLQTKIVDQPDAPVRISGYDAVLQPYQEGVYTFSLLEETLTFQNVTSAVVRAVDIGVVYANAFGEEVEWAFESIIGDVPTDASRTEIYRNPKEHNTPIYTAVAFVSRVRLEGSGGRDRVWEADSVDVNQRIDRLINDFELARR